MGQLSVGMNAKIELLQTTHEVKPNPGVTFPRYFTAKLEAGKTPYDEVRWETPHRFHRQRQGRLSSFEQRDVEVPVDWSQTATNIVASKYFHGNSRSPERETAWPSWVPEGCDAI